MFQNLVIFFGCLLMMATLTKTESEEKKYDYSTIAEEGKNKEGLVANLREYIIADMQCTAELDYPLNFNCKDSNGLTKDTEKTHVQVLDFQAPAKIVFANDQRRVSIYRFGGCAGAALVKVRSFCDQGPVPLYSAVPIVSSPSRSALPFNDYPYIVYNFDY